MTPRYRRWHANPDGDNCVDNLVVRHSYLVGGHGITFIPWGTDNPRLDMQEIENVEVYDSCRAAAPLR